jgi:rubredoxin
MAKPEEMYQCQGNNCGYIYNPDKGCKKKDVDKGTCFDDVPDDFKCPSCGAGKQFFKSLAGPGSTAKD